MSSAAAYTVQAKTTQVLNQLFFIVENWNWIEKIVKMRCIQEWKKDNKMI